MNRRRRGRETTAAEQIIDVDGDDDDRPDASIYDIGDGERRNPAPIEADVITTPQPSASTSMVPTRAAQTALNPSTAMTPATGAKAVDWPVMVFSVAQYALIGYGAYSLYKGKKTKGAVMLGASLALFLSGKYINKLRSQNT